MTLNDLLLRDIRQGDIPAPPGMDAVTFSEKVTTLLPTSTEWAWVLEALVRHRLVQEEHLATHTLVTNALESMRVSAASFNATAAVVLKHVKDLDAVVRPLFQTPDDPSNEGVLEWRNLWAFWQFVPGTLKPRVLLTLWELGNWGLASLVGYLLGRLGFGGLSWLGGTTLLVVLLFVKHELLYRWYGSRVCGVPEREHDPGPGFVSTLERWRGPTY